MNSRERTRRALNHQEPHRIPFDLGGTGLTTIYVDAYQALRKYLRMPRVETRVMALAEQLAVVDEDLADRIEAEGKVVVLAGPCAGIVEL